MQEIVGMEWGDSGYAKGYSKYYMVWGDVGMKWAYGMGIEWEMWV